MKISELGRPDILGVIIGVVGIILAFMFYVRSKEKVKPSYAIITQELIGTSDRHLPEAVEIRYDGQPVPTLYKATIFFWNRGTKTLDQRDIAPSDLIKFHLQGSGAKLLEVRSIKATRSVLNPSFVQAKNDVTLSFDFLDREDGLALEVFYSGQDSVIDCSGTVKGAKKGIQRRASKIKPEDRLSLGRLPVRSTRSVIVSSIFSIAVGVITIGLSTKNAHGHPITNYATLALGLSVAVVGIIGLIIGIYFYMNENIPRGLRSFD